MSYRLREGVSYCQVDGCLVFLDLEKDRYFRLPERLEQALHAWVKDDVAPEADVCELLARNVLTRSRDLAPPPALSAIAAPTRSALEETTAPAGAPASATLEALAIVCRTQLQLKTRRLHRIIATTIAQRRRRTAGFPPGADGATTRRLLEGAIRFRRSRLYVPIETCCLLDSLSMVRFLARRGLFVNLVFGVALDPFAAHCWVQAGDWVLNDTLGNVAAHTPILEI